MGKGKLVKFAELETFRNVYQASDYRTPNPDMVALSGRWAKEIFGNDNPIVLELACGKGDYTLALAKMYPEKNFIGVDIKGARIHVGAREAIAEEMDNVRFFRTRIELLDQVLSKDEVSEIWITFPDPFPRSKHKKHRLTSPRYIELYKRICKDNALVHLKTDSMGLFGYTQCVLRDMEIKPAIFQPDIYGHNTFTDELRIKTYYEKMHLQDGAMIHHIAFPVGGEDQPDFFQRVYEVTRHIPPGRVTNYGAIAKFLGSARSSRMVGWAMNQSFRVFPPVPAHRVVNRVGMLTGRHHIEYPEQMQELLEEEGVRIVGDQVMDFDKLFWDPMIELGEDFEL